MKNRIVAFMTVLSVLFITCEEEEVTKRDYPRLHTLEVSNIAENGARFNAEIIYRGSSEIWRYGFVWTEEGSPSLENADKVVFTKKLESSRFTADINSTLKEGVVYYVRPFVETRDYIVYGKVVQFQSMGSSSPEILSFFPRTGSWGDTIKISGRNFSYLNQNNSVKFGNLASAIVKASDSSLLVLVPSGKNESSVKISVTVSEDSSVSKDDFHYLIPVIESVQPLSGTFNDTIAIRGKNFNQYQEYISVVLGGVSSEIVYVGPGEMKFVVPEGLTKKESQLGITSAGIELLYKEKFFLAPPAVLSFEPEVVTRPEEVITIRGTNFNPTAKNNKIEIGGSPAEVLEASGNHLKVKLPKEVIPRYNVSVFKTVKVKLTVAEQSDSVRNLEVLWHSTWTRKKDFPGEARFNAVAFAIGGKGYFGTGMSTIDNISQYYSDFWEYDPAKDEWVRTQDFPGKPRSAASAFVIAGEGYVGLGSEYYYYSSSDDPNHLSDFYRYNPVRKSWVRIADFDGAARHSAASFAILDQGYIATGSLGYDETYMNFGVARDVWKYDPLPDTWTRILNFPTSTTAAVGFSIGNVGYVYDRNILRRFNGNEWIKLNAPELGASEIVAFSIGELAYFGLGQDYHVAGTHELWEFDPRTEQFNKRSMDYQDSRWGASVFVINGKAYVVGGVTYKEEYLMLKDVWEFDPSKPEL